jgi:hypothetical protein
MHRTIEAIIEADGTVRLLEPIEGGAPRRALVTLLDDGQEEGPFDLALLSEAALSDWLRVEEDEAWSHLQQE